MNLPSKTTNKIDYEVKSENSVHIVKTQIHRAIDILLSVPMNQDELIFNANSKQLFLLRSLIDSLEINHLPTLCRSVKGHISSIISDGNNDLSPRMQEVLAYLSSGISLSFIYHLGEMQKEGLVDFGLIDSDE